MQTRVLSPSSSRPACARTSNARTKLENSGARCVVPFAQPPTRQEETDRFQQLEDEIISDNVLDYLLPRQVRQVVIGFSSASCLLGTFLAATASINDPSNLQNAGINFLGFLGFGAVFYFDRQSQEKKIQRRRQKRIEQVKSGEREIVVDKKTGRETTRLKEVDDEWILRKLEGMARKDNMPMIGPEKGALLQALIREANPKVVVEVGSMMGYSSIKIAQALPDSKDVKVVSLEKDFQFSVVAKRFLNQASEGQRNKQRTVPVGEMITVVQGDATQPAQYKMIVEKCGGPIDFLFLDGVPKETLTYLQAAEPYLAPGCTIVADNAVVFKEGGMKPYLEYVRGNTEGKFESTKTVPCKLEWRDDVEDGLEVTTLKK